MIKRMMSIKTIALLAVGASLFSVPAHAGRVSRCTEECTNAYVSCLNRASGYWEEVWCYLAYEGDMVACIALGPDE